MQGARTATSARLHTGRRTWGVACRWLFASRGVIYKRRSLRRMRLSCRQPWRFKLSGKTSPAGSQPATELERARFHNFMGATSPLAGLPFLKMNGIGNRILVMDLRGRDHVITPDEARAIAAGSRSQFDQLMALHDSASAAAFMRIYNNDGTASAACGNGTRCVAWALGRNGGPSHMTLETSAGALAVERISETRFTVDMDPPRFDWRAIPLAHDIPDPDGVAIDLPDWRSPGPASVLGMGNPHLVCFTPNQECYDLAIQGPALEHHPLFPQRANVSFAQVLDRSHIALRVWERGAGPTLACGTAACATVVAAIRRGLTDRDVAVALPGGELSITWRENDGHVLMTGPVELEWEDRLPADFTTDAL